MRFSTRQDIAIHEAAHAVAGHEVGGTVNSVDIGGGPEKKRKASIIWSVGLPPLSDIDWLDADVSEKARAAVRAIVTCFVAGEVAEKALKPDMQLLSDRITDEDFAYGGKIGTDRETVIWFLCQIQCPDIAEVRAAELRAKEILDARPARLSAIAERLLEFGYIADKDLAEALSM